ncbi:DUF1349 domain-containing protein [Paenibacillus sp. YPG26]|uniref:DUF1349 domain-containing protein n=1 Tax=Paenibacillus sp. YPG26 TaxID=2878915 RepID=UPI00203EF332|nr:DUF1349 domain-containing protein [Paenibacillus sp. YPG26]USB33779.1 DUF1349 domain-containing protein [Paenibacillus sp. YPG26]
MRVSHTINFRAEHALPEDYYWVNEPELVKWNENQGLVLTTKPDTDFWQRTHYGFQRDNGHCLFTKVAGDFAFAAEVSFAPVTQYDQCGVMLRVNKEHWIKASIEYENESFSRLGSVVTNRGYSDWATTDISNDIKSMSYRISRRGQDVLIEYKAPEAEWKQMRIAHLHELAEIVEVGIYACSPRDRSFSCSVAQISLGPNRWEQEE